MGKIGGCRRGSKVGGSGSGFWIINAGKSKLVARRNRQRGCPIAAGGGGHEGGAEVAKSVGVVARTRGRVETR